MSFPTTTEVSPNQELFTPVSATVPVKLSGADEAASSSALETLKRYTITLTGILPLSSRGIVINLIKTPLRFFQSFGQAFAEMVKQRSIEAFRTTFAKKIVKHLKRDWTGGISDHYLDLSLPNNKAEGLAVAKDYLRYAGFMYDQSLETDWYNQVTSDIAWEGTKVMSSDPAEEENNGRFSEVVDEIKKLGFKEDSMGQFYDAETGNMFTLVHDEANKELVICFMGFGNEVRFDIDREEQKKMGNSAVESAKYEMLGGVTDAAVQGIKLGEILKEHAGKLGLTPVAVGHSHGAGIAQCAAVANGIKGVNFNSRPMGAGVRRYIGQSKIAKNAKHITTFSGQKDWLSHTRGLNVLGVLIERLFGIVVPRSVGKGYDLPPAFSKPVESVREHVGFYRSFCNLVKQG
ncbi:MAG: hypothetical protein ACHQUC_04870 [Chlamydiales bacterium]